MKKLMLTLIIPMCLAACAKSEDAKPADTAQLEAQAVSAGVFIKYDAKNASYGTNYGWYSPMTIELSGVGHTESEMNSAITALRNYYNGVAAIDITPEERNYRREKIMDAVAILQARRTDLLAKQSACGGTAATK